MKKARQEPVYLLEMSHPLRTMIMRRGLMLRSCRARTLFCLNKGGQKAWLEAKLITASGESTEENWDKAHDLARKFKMELHADIYVEPATEFGRFKEMTAPPLPDAAEESESMHSPGMDGIALPHMPRSDLSVNRRSPVSGAGFGSGFAGGGFPGMSFPGMPHIPDPMRDLLPPQVRNLMNNTSQSPSSGVPSRPKLTFSALSHLYGWGELSETKQKMFEVEAAQLLHASQPNNAENIVRDFSLASSEITPADAKALAALTAQPKLSRALKRLLLETFEALSTSAREAKNA